MLQAAVQPTQVTGTRALGWSLNHSRLTSKPQLGRAAHDKESRNWIALDTSQCIISGGLTLTLRSQRAGYFLLLWGIWRRLKPVTCDREPNSGPFYHGRQALSNLPLSFIEPRLSGFNQKQTRPFLGNLTTPEYLTFHSTHSLYFPRF